MLKKWNEQTETYQEIPQQIKPKRPPKRKINSKQRCRAKSKRLLQLGIIQKEPCQNCINSESLQMHHADYTKPETIVWLCLLCHIKEHERLGDIDAVRIFTKILTDIAQGHKVTHYGFLPKSFRHE